MDITRKAAFDIIDANYSPVSTGWTTRRSALVAATFHLKRDPSLRIIQGGYDENGDGYFREVYPRIMRTWEPRRPALSTVSA